jgi:hypothetical protein
MEQPCCPGFHFSSFLKQRRRKKKENPAVFVPILEKKN